jgi:nucleoside 2-deoxyribosyltransferase
MFPGGRSIGVVRDLAKVQAWVRVPSTAPFLHVPVFLILMLAYLCGPIEFAADGGKMWRRKLTPFLHNELGHRVYDPAEDEKKSLTGEEAAHFREWKRTDVERFRRVVRKIIQFDLDIIENKTDYVICYLGEDGAATADGGTSSELTFAYRRGIPVYLVTDADAEQVSGWMLACADRVFSNVDELKKFLLERFGKEKQTPLWRV